MKYSKITISGKICTGKSSLFRSLEKILGWETFSSGAYFREYAKTHHLMLNDAEEQTEKITMKVDSMVKQKLHEKGNLLVDAWLGGILAENIPGVLKILLIADDAVRFRRFAEREKTTIKTAKKEVLKRDTSWFEKVSLIHRRSDFFDKKNYDLIIDTTSLSPEEITDIVLEKVGIKPSKQKSR